MTTRRTKDDRDTSGNSESPLPSTLPGETPDDAATPTFPPAHIAHFEIDREIGQGAMGRVFLAHDTRLGRDVALKLMLRHDAASRERFAREARAVARLQHQNIISIYDVAEHDGQPYIVEEYVSGQSLAACPKPMPWQQALTLGLALADGLAAAHDSGVLHRDIKPANVMISNAGVPKLVDFGLAKLAEDTETAGERAPANATPTNATHAGANSIDARALTRSDAVLGTPYYMAPEIWQGRQATPASDVYALGVLLHELCTGRVPHHDVPVGHLQRVVREHDAPPIRNIDQRFAAVIERCLARDPAARHASGKALHAALAAIPPDTASRAALAENPYPGLRAFDRDHRAYFFGRDADIRAAAARLEQQHVLLIAGESGVGKSSLVRAGVLPWIAEHGLDGIASWWACTLLPDQHALAALSMALSARLGMDASSLRAALMDDVIAVGDRLQRVHGDDAGTVIFVDQLEQLVTLCAQADAAAMAAALDYLASRVPRVRVLATVRGDQLTRLAHLPGLGSRIERALYILRPLGEAQVREAAVRPAEARGVRFASAAMVDALATATLRASGGLPLLQFALSQLWEHRDVHRDVIPGAALAQIGGVEGALARHADQVVDGLRSARAAREVLLRLVLLHEARARHTEDALVHGDDDRRKALEALVAGRLVVASESDGAPVYEIAHEALLTGWPRLRHWLDEEGEQRAVQRRLAFAAAEWERLGHSREALWKQRRLREAVDMDPETLGPMEVAFLHESRRQVRRGRRLRQIAILLPFLLLGSIYGGVYCEQQRRLHAEVDDLLRRAAPLVEQAHASSEEYRRARRQAEAHLRAGRYGAGEAAWQRALPLAPVAEIAMSQASQPLELAFRRDPGRGDVRQTLADVLHEQALLAETMGREATLAHLVAQLESHADSGDLAARWTAAIPVALTTSPPLPATLHRYEKQPDGTLAAVAQGPARHTPHTWQLTPGSYLLVVGPDERSAAVRFPFRVLPGRDPGVPLSLHLDVPARDQVPEGFVHVPAGAFVFGYGGDEAVEPVRTWYAATPPHQRHTAAFMIARHETTYEEWIAFLHTLPPPARAVHMPRGVRDTVHVALSETNGQLTLELGAINSVHRAVAGQRMIYAARDRRREQDWRRLPVTGISGEDARAYVSWLDRIGVVPGARLCREDEWERAARGADARLFPHGNRLAPDDANFDATYGKKEGAYGLDEVGSYPRSQSPFGVDDLAGNARELTVSMLDPDMLVVRGGDFFRSPRTSAVVNREVVTATQRTPHMGLRVCADAQGRRVH